MAEKYYTVHAQERWITAPHFEKLGPGWAVVKIRKEFAAAFAENHGRLALRSRLVPLTKAQRQMADGKRIQAEREPSRQSSGHKRLPPLAEKRCAGRKQKRHDNGQSQYASKEGNLNKRKPPHGFYTRRHQRKRQRRDQHVSDCFTAFFRVLCR